MFQNRELKLRNNKRKKVEKDLRLWICTYTYYLEDDPKNYNEAMSRLDTHICKKRQ